MSPPPYTSVVHVRAITGIQQSEKQDRDIAAAIEYAWRELRAKAGETLDGIREKEWIGTSDGVQYKYRVRFYPILDKVEEAGGVPTNDASKIVVTTTAPGTQETYDTVASTDYLIHGKDGLVFFKSTGIPPQNYEIYVSYKYSADLIRHLETLLAAYYIFQSMPNSREKANEYLARFQEEFDKILTNEFNDNIQTGGKWDKGRKNASGNSNTFTSWWW